MRLISLLYYVYRNHFRTQVVYGIFILITPLNISFAQESYTLTFSFSFNSLILPGEYFHNLIGDTVYVDIVDTNYLNEIEYFEDRKKVTVLDLSNTFMVIDSVHLLSKHGFYYLKLKSIKNDLSIGLRINPMNRRDEYIPKKVTLIRKSVYNAFKLLLMDLVFDTGISINLNTINAQSDTSYDYDDVVFENLSRLDTHEVKKYHMDSLSNGWRVKKILILDSEDLFKSINTVNNNSCSNSESEIGYGMQHICLLTENYLGHSQMVQLSQINEHQFLSEIPLIKKVIPYKKRYGNIQWQKSRFLLSYYNIVDPPEHDSDSKTKSGYLEPVVSNNRISYFKNATLLTFSLRYRDYIKKKSIIY